MTRVLIVEDFDLMMEALVSAVNAEGRYRVTGTTKNADIAPALCSMGNVDLVLMDICTELDSSGLDAAEVIKQNYPDIKIVLITSMPEATWLEKARSIGVESFWYKRSSKELLGVMDRTMEGESVYPDTTQPVKIGNAYNYEFTKREIDVLRELTNGTANRDIAAKLEISEETVNFYVKKLLRKTGLQNRTKLAVEARRVGFVIEME